MTRAGHKSDVIVLGAGIVGLACAYFLADAGLDVLVLDRGLPGSGDSVRTGGGVRSQFATVANIQLSRLSLPIWDSFEERFGIDPRFHRIGYLFLASTPETAASLRERVALQHAHGVPSEYLRADSIPNRWQSLTPGRWTGASFCASDGYLDHHRAVQGFYQGALGAGARVLTGTAVTDLVFSAGRVVGVMTNDGKFVADTVVNAAGAAAGRIAEMAGLKLPISPRRHELIVVQPEKPIPEAMPWLVDVDRQVHMRPDGQGRALVGGFLGVDEEVDPDGYDPRPDPDWVREVLRVANQSFGLVEPEAQVLRGWAGLYPSLPDHHPVIELSQPGLATAAGFSGTGLMHAPAAGLLVAELVKEGRATSLDLAELGSERFERGVARVESSGF